MTDWDDIWGRLPSKPITDDGLAYLRGQVADRMADVAVGPLIARIDAVEAERGRLLSLLGECEIFMRMLAKPRNELLADVRRALDESPQPF